MYKYIFIWIYLFVIIIFNDFKSLLYSLRLHLFDHNYSI